MSQSQKSVSSGMYKQVSKRKIKLVNTHNRVACESKVRVVFKLALLHEKKSQI